MTNFKFPAVLNEGDAGTLAVVTAFNSESDTPVYTADEKHPHFRAILQGLEAGDPNVWRLFDVLTGVVSSFNAITDRVSYDGEQVLWDGDPVHSTLADQLVRAIEDGNPDNYTALAKFWEKLESNPNEHSRTQAYDWLSCHKFQITPEGDVVGFKGVSRDPNGNGWVSGWASQVPDVPSAYVDGQPIAPLSQVPNNIGTVVTMPRSEVIHDPRQACKRGLHVSTRGYAGSYAHGTILEVHVNPRDIVSVPTDGGGAKVRACRYYIAREAVSDEEMGASPVLRENGPSIWPGDVGYKV